MASDPLLRSGSGQLLEDEADFKVVAQAETGEDALGLLETLGPDVALVDADLLGMSGFELARTVAARGLRCRMLMLGGDADIAHVTEALDAGSGGYLLKTAPARELIDAVRAVADGIVVLDSAASASIGRGSGRRANRRQPPAAALSARETDVLNLLARGLSNKDIAAELSISVRTAEGQVSRVLAKLGVASRTEAVAYALSRRLPSFVCDIGDAQSR